MTVTILPQGVIRLVPGRSSNYTDTSGNIWFSGQYVGGDGSCSFTTQSCYGYSNGGSWPSTPDITLYEMPIYTNDNDLRFDISVPNGTYQITGKFTNNSTSDLGNFIVEVQGVAGSVVDIYSLAGGGNKPYDITTNATVTNGVLSYVLRRVDTTGANVAPFISALQIEQISGN